MTRKASGKFIFVEKKYNYVYITTNLKTKKSYVGAHSTNNLKDGYIGGGKELLASVKKYGKKCFVKTIISFHKNILNARKREAIEIKKNKTIYPLGYNLSPTGGTHCSSYKTTHGEETKKRLSKLFSGKNNPMFGTVSPSKGKPHSEETRKKLSELATRRMSIKKNRIVISKANKGKIVSKATRLIMSKNNSGENNNCFGRVGKKHPMYGKKHSEEIRRKISIETKKRMKKCNVCGKLAFPKTLLKKHGKNCKKN